MRRHDTALAVHECELGAIDLTYSAFATQLLDCFRDVKHRAWMARMAMREQAAVRVHGQLAAELDTSAFDEAAAFTLGTKTQILELDNHDRREAIVKLGDVDIARCDSRHRLGALAGFLGRRCREAARLADVLVRMTLADAEHVDRLLGKVAGALR